MRKCSLQPADIIMCRNDKGMDKLVGVPAKPADGVGCNRNHRDSVRTCAEAAGSNDALGDRPGALVEAAPLDADAFLGACAVVDMDIDVPLGVIASSHLLRPLHQDHGQDSCRCVYLLHVRRSSSLHCSTVSTHYLLIGQHCRALTGRHFPSVSDGERVN